MNLLKQFGNLKNKIRLERKFEIDEFLYKKLKSIKKNKINFMSIRRKSVIYLGMSIKKKNVERRNFKLPLLISNFIKNKLLRKAKKTKRVTTYFEKNFNETHISSPDNFKRKKREIKKEEKKLLNSLKKLENYRSRYEFYSKTINSPIQNVKFDIEENIKSFLKIRVIFIKILI